MALRRMVSLSLLLWNCNNFIFRVKEWRRIKHSMYKAYCLAGQCEYTHQTSLKAFNFALISDINFIGKTSIRNESKHESFYTYKATELGSRACRDQ
jgi:hypothetical protein